ncbi:unnamed protein product [Toxocara canis]|uniref:SH2 domain-containing protein n=1 Tax=Toxocara canis TaxID=6265 RepID=A0A183VA49_TOXCA|nr:unnamed protein product [Toxocara canis]
MLVDADPKLSKSVQTDKWKSSVNLDELDRVPVDFSDPNGPTLMTDSDEIGEMLTHGETRAIYTNQPTIYGLAPCSIYRAERWFHHDADRIRAERMLFRTGRKDGSFLIRVNDYNCLVITVCYRKAFWNIAINCKVDGHNTKVFIERDHQFSNLVDLIVYYTRNQGAYLPCRLAQGVALRWPGSAK